MIEDAHWADDMSVRLLAFLGRRLHQTRLLVVATIREEELADVGLLQQSLHELDEQGALRRLPVAALSRADTAALVQALAPEGLPSQLVANLAQDAWRVSDGIPFVVIELMHALREGQTLSLAQRLPLPARVRKLVQHRLERLPARGRRLVAAAAVIGRQFDFSLVQRAADMSEREAAEAVEELVRHRVLRGAGDGLEFSHDHIRDVATSDLPAPLRIALHRRVAESLEDVYAHDLPAHALALGTHYRNGEAWEKSAVFLHMAGRQAALRSAHSQAVACFEEALNALRRLPSSAEVDDRDLDVRIELRQSLYPMGRFADLIRHLREAERVAEKLDAGPRLARVSAYISNYAWITGDLPQALACGRRTLELAERLANGGLVVEGNFRLGQVHWSLGQYREALAFFERCGTADPPGGEAARYGPSGWPTEFGLAELSLYYVAAPLTELGRFDEALAAARRALDYATRTDRPFALAGSFAAIGRAYLLRGRLGEAAAALLRGLEVSRRWEFSVHRPWLAAALGYAYALAGRVTKGLSILRDAVDEADRLGNVTGHAWRLDRAGRGAAPGRASRGGRRHSESSPRAVAEARGARPRSVGVAPARRRSRGGPCVRARRGTRPVPGGAHAGRGARDAPARGPLSSRPGQASPDRGRARRRVGRARTGNRDVPGHGHAALADPGAATRPGWRARGDLAAVPKWPHRSADWHLGVIGRSGRRRLPRGGRGPLELLGRHDAHHASGSIENRDGRDRLLFVHFLPASRALHRGAPFGQVPLDHVPVGQADLLVEMRGHRRRDAAATAGSLFTLDMTNRSRFRPRAKCPMLSGPRTRWRSHPTRSPREVPSSTTTIRPYMIASMSGPYRRHVSG